ncbi:hypothetical protein N7539_007935 [Penicillium diatomitis]|uniref:Uncharacterized protein n=1 Tax=Penicillium diatomitis TaxID=2819901 RepID=A0A9X0BNR2_9EURO|nr:uncharacterized protein N7539_007935 [Penicillium diatomitis]KAJ5475648.1 hypothetical protein N7539_007935 [Penicillium diatomitis]
MSTTWNSSHSFSQASSLASTSVASATAATRSPSSHIVGVVEQPHQPPLNYSPLPAAPTNPAGAASLPHSSVSAYLAQPVMAQTQPLAQSLSNLTGAPAVEQQQIEGTEVTLSTHQPAAHYPHQVSGSGGPTATAPFLQDFSLVAEAAKRAQLSIIMRDLESVTL